MVLLQGEDIGFFKHYINNIRHNIAAPSHINCALITKRGKPLAHYKDMVASFCKKLHIDCFPSLTTFRKAGATKAVSQADTETLEKIRGHMSHSTTTSERYYRTCNKVSSAVTAFESIDGKW